MVSETFDPRPSLGRGRGSAIRGVVPDALVSVVDLEVAQAGRPWIDPCDALAIARVTARTTDLPPIRLPDGTSDYLNQTAGFEVPAHERVCPVCSDPLLPSEDLIGRGDREGPDGALHGLWIHFRCAGKPTVPEIADDYWAASHHPDLDADPKAREAHGTLMRRLLAKVRR